MDLSPVQKTGPDPDATGDISGRGAIIALLLGAAITVALSAIWAVAALVAIACAGIAIRLDRGKEAPNMSIEWSAWAILVVAVLSLLIHAGIWLSH